MVRLTPRETELMNLIADGHTNKSIGKHMGLVHGTVKVYINHIRAKIEGPRMNRVELVLWWLGRQGRLQDKEAVA